LYLWGFTDSADKIKSWIGKHEEDIEKARRSRKSKIKGESEKRESI
jgi:hypothetical protein